MAGISYAAYKVVCPVAECKIAFNILYLMFYSYVDKSLIEQILQGPIGIGIGIVFGYVYGLMLTILPSTKTVSEFLKHF